jgi:hypothetical protein
MITPKLLSKESPLFTSNLPQTLSTLAQNPLVSEALEQLLKNQQKLVGLLSNCNLQPKKQEVALATQPKGKGTSNGHLKNRYKIPKDLTKYRDKKVIQKAICKQVQVGFNRCLPRTF